MYGGTAVDGYFVNSLGVATTEVLHDNSFYKNSSGQYIFNGSTVSSMPYNYNTKSDIVDGKAPYQILSSTTYTSSGTEGGCLLYTSFERKR